MSAPDDRCAKCGHREGLHYEGPGSYRTGAATDPAGCAHHDSDGPCLCNGYEARACDHDGVPGDLCVKCNVAQPAPIKCDFGDKCPGHASPDDRPCEYDPTNYAQPAPKDPAAALREGMLLPSVIGSRECDMRARELARDPAAALRECLERGEGLILDILRMQALPLLDALVRERDDLHESHVTAGFDEYCRGRTEASAAIEAMRNDIRRAVEAHKIESRCLSDAPLVDAWLRALRKHLP